MSQSRRCLFCLCFAMIFVGLMALVLPFDMNVAAREQDEDREEACEKLRQLRGHWHQSAEEIENACPSAGSSQGIAKGDFNGDGFADLAIGIPGKAIANAQQSGAVLVIYGSANGLTATDTTVPASQLWTQENTRGISETGDLFGWALASGDFNGDGFSDLAIGVPGDVARGAGGETTGGRVGIVYGSANGLTRDIKAGVPTPQFFSLLNINDGGQLVRFVANSRADFLSNGTSASFGSALAWGDFNGDGVGDLAIGAPKARKDDGTFQGTEVGAVAVLFGTRTGGLTSIANQLWMEGVNLAGIPAAGNLFGVALTSGDFNGDGRSDLAVGIPGEDFGQIQDAGAVEVIYGSASGLAGAGHQLWDADVPGILLVTRTGAKFGWSLASGDFNGDGRSDLAIGTPFDPVGSVSNAGSVHILFGASNGLTVTGNQALTQNSLFNTTLASETGDGFGFALAAGDFNGDGRADLAIGVPFQGFFNTKNAGEADVIYGSTSGLSRTAGPGSQSWHQSFGGVDTLGGTAETGDAFGLTLSAWNFGKNTLIPPSKGHPVPQVIKTADLAVGVPFEDLFSHIDHVTPLPDAGAVNVIYGSLNGLTTTGNQFWSLDSPGVPGDAAAEDTLGLGLY